MSSDGDRKRNGWRSVIAAMQFYMGKTRTWVTPKPSPVDGSNVSTQHLQNPTSGLLLIILMTDVQQELYCMYMLFLAGIGIIFFPA